MKKTIAVCMLTLLVATGGIGEVLSPATVAPLPVPLSDQELSSAVGGGFWSCAFTFVAASALVVGAGALTAGTGALFVGAVLASGTFGLTAELKTCS
ncbi:MAG: hypothetical protein ACRD1B_08765 [Thermoanaerobaculia bacterium]